MRDFIQRTVFGPHHRWWALGVVVMAVFIATTDVGLLTISLPVIITEFRTDIAFAGWIVFIYALVTGALYLPSGRLSDLIGRKETFSAGFLIYGIASAAAGLSQSPLQLIACRVLQAVGSALMMTNTFALTASLFTGRERGRAMGLSGGLVSALGFTLGPVIGGFITYTLGWRFIFFVSAALAAIGFVAARLLLIEKAPVRPNGREPFDFTGAGAFALGLSFLLLGITTGRSGFLGYWGFLLAFLFLAFFIWWEARIPYPILDLTIFRIVPFAAGNVARMATFIALSTNELIMPFFLQFVLHMDPLEAGSLMTPTALALAVFSPLSGWLSDRLGTTLPAALGALIFTAALLLLGLLDQDAGAGQIVLRLALLGIGLGLFQTPNNNALISSVPANRLGIASSFISIVRSVGRSLGTAMATAILSARLVAATGPAPHDPAALKMADDPALLSAFMHGYGYAYAAAACLGVVALAASLIKGRRRPHTIGSEDTGRGLS